MNRRSFLGALGATASAGFLGRRALAAGDPLAVRVWTSERAARHDGLVDRVRGYLRAGLEPVVGPVDVDVAERSVRLPSEDGRTVLARYWPRLVVEGIGGLSPIEPVGGVNLLVTDGDPTTYPAGFARPHVAATTGASAIAEMPPASETEAVVPYSVPAAATQLLLHECGHALGLGHDHGTAYEADGDVVVTPMVGSYLWKDADVRRRKLGSPENACGQSVPWDGGDGGRRVGLRFSECARTALRDGV